MTDWDIFNQVHGDYQPKKRDGINIGFLMKNVPALNSRGTRLLACNDWLTFGRPVDIDTGEIGDVHLKRASFCRDRMCPLCSWRRSTKLFSQTCKTVEYIRNDLKYVRSGFSRLRWAMLTLTIVNPTLEDYPAALARMQYAWSKLRKLDIFSGVIGWMKNEETTYNHEKKTLHPHYHILCVVDDSFPYVDEAYISEEVCWRWARCYGDLAITQVKWQWVDISDNCALLEVSKYCSKSKDILDRANTDDEKITLLTALAYGLASRRLVAYGGLLKEIRALLKLRDIENVDLTDDGDADLWLTYYYRFIMGSYAFHHSNIESLKLPEESPELLKIKKLLAPASKTVHIIDKHRDVSPDCLFDGGVDLLANEGWYRYGVCV